MSFPVSEYVDGTKPYLTALFSFGLNILIKHFSFARRYVGLSVYILQKGKMTYFGFNVFAQLSICSLTLSILVLGSRIYWLCTVTLVLKKFSVSPIYSSPQPLHFIT